MIFSIKKSKKSDKINVGDTKSNIENKNKKETSGKQNDRRPWTKEDIVKELINCCNE